MNVIERRKAAEAASLSRMGTAILKGNKLGVKFLPDGAPELGFTSGTAKVVNVAWYNEQFFKMLDDIESSMLRMGVFAHELLHQCLTNFAYTNTVCETMSRAEAAVFMKFANTLEDPAIEYFAPNIMGGRLLEALRFSIKHIYKLSPGIEKSGSAFSQLINALIHFGDMGIVKGKFTYPESYEYFIKVAPLYNEGITCPNSKRRIDIAKECMEITKPLWEEEVKNAELFEELIKELMEMMKRSGLHLMEDEEEEMGDPSDSTDASERRSSMVSKMKGESSDKKEDSSSSSESPSDEESTEEDSESTSGGSDDKNESDSDNNEQSDDSKSSDSKSSDSSSEENNSKGGSDVPFSDGDLTLPEEEANEVAEDTYIIDEEVVSQVEQSIKAEEEKIEKASKREAENDSSNEMPNFDISSTAFKSASCINKKVVNATHSSGLSEMYKKMVKEYSWEIKNLTKTLDKIFKSDMEENNRATSGSYNIMRGSIGTTARIFDKRRDPGNLKDAQIVLAVDLSGSMCGQKINQARKTSIVLAESLSNLGIPYYIMGYTADRGADAVHNHFVDWRNSKKDRETLACMEAGGNNFDGYSIRYASELLRGRNSNHKILFVISDGEPACRKYSAMATGLADTTNAIKEARKFCTVFGIALGRGCSPTTLQKMYGKDFIYCEDEKMLTNTLCKKLEKILLSHK